MSNRDNLGKLFNAAKFDKFDKYDKYSKRKESYENDFARMFETSQKDPHMQRLMAEKWHGAKHSPPQTIHEKIKKYPPPQAEMDLHGCTATEAKIKIDAFITNASERGLRTVRIIVGKGLHSQGKAVLPGLTENQILLYKQSRRILSYNWEHKDKRKSGSIIIYL